MAVIRTACVCVLVTIVVAAGPPASARAQLPGAPAPSCRVPATELAAGSLALGKPNRGRLRRGLLFPATTTYAFTWDFPLGASPSRPWRRWGTEKLVRTLECVLTAVELAHPFGQRVGVADLSRPGGGPFGRRYGGMGHASHQNGLDADVLYPRRDDCECAPLGAADVDVPRAQELVTAFVAAGAQYVFVSPELWRRGLVRGPRAVVRPLAYHDDHLHVRLRP